MVRMFRKTLALSLTVLGMTSTLALAQPGNTNVNTGTRASTAMAGSAGTSATSAADSVDPYGNQSWDYVGSGGNNLGLHNGRNPYAEPREPRGSNGPGADRSGYFVSPGS